MAICTSGEKLLQEATGIRRGRVYPVAKNAAYAKSWQVSCKELEKKLSSIEDRGQTDRADALPRPYALDIDLWPWYMTLTFNPRWAMVMTNIQTKLEFNGQSFQRYSENKRTNRWMLPIVLHSRLTPSVKNIQTAINLAIGIVNISHVSDSARKCCKNVRI